jgi:hypothetical protein
MTATDLDLSSSERLPATSGTRRTRVDPPHGPEFAADDAAGGSLRTAKEASVGSTEDDLAEPAFPEECQQRLAVAGAAPEAMPLALEVEEPTEAMLAAVAGASLDAQRQQFQLQVAQLAEHLQARLRDVDRRESLLAAREAQLEAELRAARLWYQERHQELQQREQAWIAEREGLQAQIEDLTRQLSLLRSASENEQEAAWAAKHAELAAWEAELDRRSHKLEAQAASLQQSQAAAQPLEELRQALAARQAALIAAQTLLEEQTQQLVQQQASLRQDQEQWHAFQAAQRARWTRQEQQAAAELARQSHRLTQWQAALERQAAGLHQLREELMKLHRQALEARLAADEVAAQGAAAASPAAKAQALAEVHQKLAAQYRLEEESLDARRRELLALGKRLTARHEELCQLRAGLRDWLAQRQQQLQEQAAALAAHEEALAVQRQQLLAQRDALLARHQAMQQKLQMLVHSFALAQASGVTAILVAEEDVAGARTGGVEGTASAQ